MCKNKIENLEVPKGKIDVVLDTDTYNEIDDQFAIAYLLKSKEKLKTKAIYAAPFLNERSESPKDGMEKSYNEILKLLNLMNEKVEVFKGSENYLENEQTSVVSPAACDLAKRAESYSPQNPLYVVAIGAITNIASAILLNPKVAQNTVVVWLGGHSREYCDTKEFNMYQDYAAARIVMKSGVPFVQLPCMGVVSHFTFSKPELEYWLKGKNDLADYLSRNTIEFVENHAKDEFWSKVIWDVTAVAWLLNDNERFMKSRVVPVCLPSYEGFYESNSSENFMQYMYCIYRSSLLADLIKKLTD